VYFHFICLGSGFNEALLFPMFQHFLLINVMVKGYKGHDSSVKGWQVVELSSAFIANTVAYRYTFDDDELR
jgi:hypothetical protein